MSQAKDKLEDELKEFDGNKGTIIEQKKNDAASDGENLTGRIYYNDKAIDLSSNDLRQGILNTIRKEP